MLIIPNGTVFLKCSLINYHFERLRNNMDMAALMHQLPAYPWIKLGACLNLTPQAKIHIQALRFGRLYMCHLWLMPS